MTATVNTTGSNYLIRDGIVANYKFSGNSIIENATFVNVSSLGFQSFYFCANLRIVIALDTLLSIGSQCFSNCPKLEQLTLPDTIQSIGDNSFSSCTSLTSIDLPLNLSSIGSQAFYSCSKINSATFSA
ncbi:surface antigen BspA-like [Trichomonas vaginalis G3]|uniref:Surface antigen BspA-like n=1 Tax=Trichomonas vaginalis (strain ATCC PRA-98 / G3) TaxID=412133 RepID=A2D8S8_TRIV3|nr:ribonuclease inhibitor domain-containing protein [Trichomonas vaginalis G3]EAY23327.1 surface antigen BspA-like [Trichomonas vaginalis G3]KAI5533790.1 ribonuclease inhibitor domain-containing protein [Trichomonas vaginalis G3]|eukprot:XP_001584313.1 surface antigen BspA-like [Trichomonas vaginalis G3]